MSESFAIRDSKSLAIKKSEMPNCNKSIKATLRGTNAISIYLIKTKAKPIELIVWENNQYLVYDELLTKL